MTSTPAHHPRQPQGNAAPPQSKAPGGENPSTERVPWDASTALDEAMARLRSVLAESKTALAEAADPPPEVTFEEPATARIAPAPAGPSVASQPRTVPATSAAASPEPHTGSHARIEPAPRQPRTASPRRPSAGHSARPVASDTRPNFEADLLPAPTTAVDTAPVRREPNDPRTAGAASEPRSFDQLLAGEQPATHAFNELPSAYDTPMPRVTAEAALSDSVSIDEPEARTPTAHTAPEHTIASSTITESAPRQLDQQRRSAPRSGTTDKKPRRKPAADKRTRIRLTERLGVLRDLWQLRRVRLTAIAVGGALLLGAVAVPVVTQLTARSGAAGAGESSTAEGLSGEDLLAEVGTLMVLPEETPTIATVEDPATLSAEPFFARAETGDRVLIFPESRLAVLYRESQHIIINAGTLSVGVDPTVSQQAFSEEVADPPTGEETPAE